MNHCLYGTVYNNVNYVRDSVKSFFSPIYDKIVIVDSFSTDGTYEILKEMEKEYNLTILRYKSSRGKGRDYAIRHCPDNSITAYVDLDVIYNKNLEKAMKLNINRLSISGFQPTFIAYKETVVGKGGWKDLNAAEDSELVTRVGIDTFFPLVVGFNSRVIGLRESRYASSKISKLKRIWRVQTDYFRAGNNLDEVRLRRIPISLPFYISALLNGRYMNQKAIGNRLYSIYLFITNLKDPTDYGFDKNDMFFSMLIRDLEVINRKMKIDLNSEFCSKIPYVKKGLNKSEE
ncbi:MAG: glycosyltransferase family 2 protein [Candidatus Aramenus sp.]|jgi:glycosyltransferase involved in cell wall biosynthesis|nr:glycosyltransferase family 2 protein [Candidatus Aramenus sp.]